MGPNDNDSQFAGRSCRYTIYPVYIYIIYTHCRSQTPTSPSPSSLLVGRLVGWSVGWVGWLGHVTCCTDGATGCCFALAAALPARLAFVGLPGLSSLWKSVFIRHALFHSLTRKDKHWGKKYSLVTRNPCLKAKLCL